MAIKASGPGRDLRVVSRALRRSDDRTDRTLIEQLRSGDEGAFEAIYERHHAGLLSFCRHMLTAPEEAEDAVQQTFTSAYPALLDEDRAIELRPWIYSIARNHCISILRKRRETTSEAIEPSTAGLPEQVERREELRDLLKDMTELPDEQREALVLASIGSLSHEEVAKVLGCERERVKSLVHSAQTSLVGWRDAREADCEEIRELLHELRGGSLRRGLIAKHLKSCDSCRAYYADLKRKRTGLGMVIPVLPSTALKGGVLHSATGMGTIGSTAAGAGGSHAFWSSWGVGKLAATALAVGALGVGAVSTIGVARALDDPSPVPPAEASGGNGSSVAPAPQVGLVDGRRFSVGIQADPHTSQQQLTDQLIALTVELLGWLDADEILGLTSQDPGDRNPILGGGGSSADQVNFSTGREESESAPESTDSERRGLSRLFYGGER